MLRLLTSDLVLDEADDFSIEDLPALSRLVNWAGMLGSRVLLSSATLPQSLISGLFKSYQEGWRAFCSAVKQEARHDGILCAWFDEQLNPVSVISQDEESFLQAHSRFIQDRIACLKEDSQLRKAEILPISVNFMLTIIKLIRSLTNGFQ
jgi:CRISPR-associated endonuclease/helicase Cas3